MAHYDENGNPTLLERVSWWLSFPRQELIYLLGGIPNEHNGGVLHYRNTMKVIQNLKEKFK